MLSYLICPTDKQQAGGKCSRFVAGVGESVIPDAFLKPQHETRTLLFGFSQNYM